MSQSLLSRIGFPLSKLSTTDSNLVCCMGGEGEGGREGGEVEKEEVKENGKEGRREGGKEGGKEGGREGGKGGGREYKKNTLCIER